MSANFEVKKMDASTPVYGESQLPPNFSIAQAFYDLDNLFHPDKRYDLTYHMEIESSGKKELIKQKNCVDSVSFVKEVYEGILFFCSELPIDSYKSHFETLSQAITGLDSGMPDTIWRPIPAATCDLIGKSNPTLSLEAFTTAIRRTLRDVNTTLYTQHTKLPEKVYGQLLAILIFLKSLPELPGDVEKGADELYLLMQDCSDTNPIYYHIRNKLALHFQKDGSWTKTYNSSWGWLSGRYSI